MGKSLLVLNVEMAELQSTHCRRPFVEYHAKDSFLSSLK